MKHFTKYLLLLASLLLTLSFTSFAQKPGTKTASKIGKPEYLLVKRGFKKFKLGAPIEDYKKYVVLVAEDEQMGNKMYKLLTNMYPMLASIGNSIEINDVLLEVYEGIIVSIGVFVENEYKNPFLRSLQAAYGPGEKENPYIEEYVWHASNKKADISLSYVDSYKGGGHIHGNGWALFQDNNLTNKEDEDIKNKAKETVKDL